MFEGKLRFLIVPFTLAPVIAIAVFVIKAPKERPGLYVVVREEAGELSNRPPLARAARLARASLSTKERTAMQETFHRINEALEIRKNPLVEPLDDFEPDAALKTLASEVSPRMNGARLLSGEAIRIPETAFVAELATNCTEVPKGARCFSVSAPKDDLERRARDHFAPQLRALRLAILPPTNFNEAVQKLNDAASKPTSLIAIGVGPKTLSDETALAEEIGRTVSTLKELKKEAPSPLPELAVAGRAELPYWLELAGNEVLVMPRIGAKPDAAAVEREVREVLAGATIEIEPIARY